VVPSFKVSNYVINDNSCSHGACEVSRQKYSAAAAVGTVHAFACSLQQSSIGRKIHLLGMLAKLRKATVCFVVSLRPPIKMQQFSFQGTDFRRILNWGFSLKHAEKIQVWLQSYKDKQALCM
jgi:hypothetical protein